MSESQKKPLRDRLWTIFHDETSAGYARLAQVVSALILLSLVLLIIEVVLEDQNVVHVVERIDTAILVVFLIEFVLRLWTFRATIPTTIRLNPFKRLVYHTFARIRFCIRPIILVDIAALLPLIWTFIPGTGIRALRLLRVLRLFRTYQLFRYYNPFDTLASAIAANSLLFILTTMFVLISVMLGGSMFFLAEVSANGDVSTLTDGLYWAVVTLTTVGYGDITPTTSLGHAIAVAVMFAGITVIALFAGVISHTLVGHLLQLRQEQVRMSTISNHIVICGWNANVPLLLEELQLEYKAALPEIIVFANREHPPAELDPNFRYVPGDATKENELDKVRMSVAASVIIVGQSLDETSPGSADAHTILTLFTIRSYEAKLSDRGIRRKRNVHLCCEVHDPENISHARTAGADDIVLTARLSSDLLAHASAYPGMSGIFSTLLSPTDQNIYIEPIPEELSGGEPVTFQQLVDSGRTHFEALVIGYETESDNPRINPKPHEQIPSTARMIYLAPVPVSKLTKNRES